MKRPRSRRAFLVAIMLGALAFHPLTAAEVRPAVSTVQAQPTASAVQIVAHQDDDLLFMNPDLANSIRAGTRTATVYLTAGEATATFRQGKGALDHAESRQAGILSAYAQMQGIACPDATCWTREEARFGTVDLRTVDHFSLANVDLYFLNIPDSGDTDPSPPGFGAGGQALIQIWDGATVESLPMHGSPQSYDRATLTNVLVSILADRDATLVRIQDPAPDPGLWGDHEDHTQAALFADEAVDEYGAARLLTHRVAVEHYRDYNIAYTPANLTGATTAEKVATFRDTYAPYDAGLPASLSPGTPTVACDPVHSTYECWESRLRYRTPGSTQSVIADSSGALHAFAVESGRLFEWTEVDGRWTGPVLHAENDWPLTAGVSAGRNRDGRIEVFGQRADTGEIVSTFQSEIVSTLRPTATSGWSWASLSSPNPASPFQVSTPIVVTHGDGRLQIFVRNSGSGVSSRWQSSPNGVWSGWGDLGGADVQEAPAASTTRDGRIEVFAWAPRATGTKILHWVQPAPDLSLQRAPGFSIAPTSALNVAMNQDGRLELVYRQLDGTDPVLRPEAQSYTMTLRQTAPGGGWNAADEALGATTDGGGIGAPATATPGDGRVVAFVRNVDGGVSVSRQGTPNGSFGGWVDLGSPDGGPVVGVPTVGVDRDGRADLIVLGEDGRLYDNRQNTDGSFSAANWRAMGG